MTTIEVTFPSEGQAGKILKWRVRTDTMVSAGRVLLLYQNLVSGNEDVKGSEKKFRATRFGRVKKLMAKEGDIIQPGQLIILLEGCKHPTVMKDLCAECGADLRLEGVDKDGENVGISQASVPMVHSIPELKVCPELAQKIGKEDEDRLLRDKKLALLVDLDQTIVHTTNDNIPPNIKDVYHYQLYGPNSPWYHTRLRPNTRHFLSEMSRLYELHICTFGARNYAHTVASLLDKDGILFSHRILSRDECFDPASKTANLKALFPCGDDLVCIIDDREDVWQGCGNLVQVKPYHFFRHTGDIHAPPGLEKNNLPSLPDLSNTELCTNNVQNKDNKNGIMESLKGETVTDNYIKREIKTEPIENDDECVENDEDTKISIKEDIESKENITANNFGKTGKVEEFEGTEKVEEIGRTEIFEEIRRTEKFEKIGRTEKFEEIEAAIKEDKNVKKEYIDAILEADNTDNNTDNHTDNHTDNITDNHTVNNTVNNIDNHTDNSRDKNMDNSMDNSTDDNTDNNTDVNETSMKHIKEEKMEEIAEEITETLPSVETSIKIKEEKESETEEITHESIETKKIDIKENINDNKNIERIGKVEEMYEALLIKTNEKTKGEEEDISKIENNCADEDDDDYLLYLEDILRRIHGEFYADIEKGPGRKPLRDIIPRVRARVLQGIHLTFSGLIPTHQKLHQSRAYKVARAFGAEVTQDLTDKTTHLVAIKPGTAKANAAKKNGNIKIVNPDWLWTCAERWEHVDERLYPLTAKARASRIPPPHCSSPERIEEAERGTGDSFANTINPLMSFTQEEIEIMDKEVDEDMEEQEMEPPIFDTEGECTTNVTLRRRRKSSESEDSENDDDTYISAKKKKKRSNESSDDDGDDDDEDDDDPAVRFRRGEDLPDDIDLGDNSQDSIDDLEAADNEDDREWNAMGAALEREFLSE